MKEKLLEQAIKRPLTEEVRKNIGRRLKQLKKDMGHLGDVTYCWNKKKDTLFARTVNLGWVADFSQPKMVTVWVDVPFLAIPFVQPYKKMAMEMLNEEMEKLIK